MSKANQTINNGYVVRELKFEDLLVIKNWRNEQVNILRQNEPITDKDQELYWQKLNNSINEALFAIERQAAGLVGYGGFVNISRDYKKAEISFLLDTAIKENTREFAEIFKGFLRFIISYGFDELGLNRVFTETYAFRKDVIKLLEGSHFIREGVLRENVVKQGKYYDSILHSVIKKDLRVQ